MAPTHAPSAENKKATAEAGLWPQQTHRHASLQLKMERQRRKQGYGPNKHTAAHPAAENGTARAGAGL